MWKSLPAWLFWLSALLGCLLTVVFGWMVDATLDGETRFGTLGDISVTVASFPQLAISTLSNIGSDSDTPFRIPRPNIDLTGFRPVQTRLGIDVRGVLVRLDTEALQRAAGWRLLAGHFIVNGVLQYAVLALSPQLEIVKAWVVSDEQTPGKTRPSGFEGSLNGFAVLADGSMIIAFDYASLQRIDRCGRRVWFVPGQFSHAVAIEDSGDYFWTLLVCTSRTPHWRG